MKTHDPRQINVNRLHTRAPKVSVTGIKKKFEKCQIQNSNLTVRVRFFF